MHVTRHHLCDVQWIDKYCLLYHQRWYWCWDCVGPTTKYHIDIIMLDSMKIFDPSQVIQVILRWDSKFNGFWQVVEKQLKRDDDVASLIKSQNSFILLLLTVVCLFDECRMSVSMCVTKVGKMYVTIHGARVSRWLAVNDRTWLDVYREGEKINEKYPIIIKPA
jgi:hypothetical protein